MSSALLSPHDLLGSVLGNMKNLCPDSGFKYAPLANGNPRNDNAGLPPIGTSPVFLYTWYPDFFYTGAVQPGWVFSEAFNWQVSNFSGSGGAYGAIFNNALGAGTLTHTCVSVPFSLVANTQHTLSCYMDASMLTSGAIAIALFNWTNASGIGTQVAALGMNAGSSGRVSLVITTPTTTSQTFVVVLSTNGAGFNAQGSPSGYSAIWSEPQLEMGSLLTAYEESFSAGAVGTDGGTSGNRSWSFFGNLPASVQQVVDPSGAILATPLANTLLTPDGALTLTATPAQSNMQGAISGGITSVLSGFLLIPILSLGSSATGIGITTVSSGSMRNGYFLQWATGAGAITLNKVINGTVTLVATLATVAQYSQAVWYSLKVTYGATVGTNDVVTAIFGGSSTTNTVAVGSTAAQYGGSPNPVVNAVAFGTTGLKMTSYHFAQTND